VGLVLLVLPAHLPGGNAGTLVWKLSTGKDIRAPEDTEIAMIPDHPVPEGTGTLALIPGDTEIVMILDHLHLTLGDEENILEDHLIDIEGVIAMDIN